MKLTNIEIHYFGQLPSGQKSTLYTLKNAKGMTVKISDFGATIVAISVPDKDGEFDDITHGCGSLDGYLKGVPYFGATVGRYGNRIANATFKLDGETYNLAKTMDPISCMVATWALIKLYGKLILLMEMNLL
jgi:aldose 1-epimerase